MNLWCTCHDAAVISLIEQGGVFVHGLKGNSQTHLALSQIEKIIHLEHRDLWRAAGNGT